MKEKISFVVICIAILIFSCAFINSSLAYEEKSIKENELESEAESEVSLENEAEKNIENNVKIEKEVKTENKIENDTLVNEEISTQEEDKENQKNDRDIDEPYEVTEILKEEKNEDMLSTFKDDKREEELKLNNVNINVQTTTQQVESTAIEDGTYYIQSSINPKIVFDIENNSKLNSASLQLWEKSPQLSDNQKFEIKYLGDGYYIIQAKHSGKVLDVKGEGTKNGTKLQQYASNENDSQKWIIKDTGDGYVNIISKYNGLYIDVPGAMANNGIKMQLYENNGSKAQKFKLLIIKEIIGKQTIEDGTYKIKTLENEKIGLDIANASKNNEANVQIWTESNVIAKNQRFVITYQGYGYYEIKAEHSNKLLDVAGGATKSGSNVQQYQKNGTDAQKWIIEYNGDGTYSIISKKSQLYLDVRGGDIKNGSNIQIYEGNGSKAQKFILEKVEKVTCKQILNDGVYKINTALSSNMYLDISEGSYRNIANLQIWSYSSVQQQKFKVTYNKEGYYEIKSVNSGKVLDVYGGSNNNCANVQQYEANNTEYQKWILQDAGNGYYYIVSRGAENYLDVSGGRISNGVNVQMYEGNQSASQKFKFVSIQIIDNNEYYISINNSNLEVLDIDLSSSNLQLWTLNRGSQNQRFEFIYLSDENYKISCSATNKVLTVDKNHNVIQEDYNGENTQKWTIETAENGYYYIKNKDSGLYLKAEKNSIKDGSNIIVEKLSSNTNKFKFNTISVHYGIDVSEHNGIIDWAVVKQSGKVDFAMIRAGYRGYVSGKLVTDATFERNIAQANAMEINVGIYFFSQAITEYEAVEEADYVVSLLKKANVDIRYPIAIDTEYSGEPTNSGRADRLDVATRTAVCKAFCERIKSYGYIPMIYASRNWFYYNLDVSQIISYEHWVAHYTGSEQITTNYKYSYTMWQYTSSGSINGILGNVDLNIGNKKY